MNKEKEQVEKYNLQHISNRAEAINTIVKLFLERISHFNMYDNLLDSSVNKIYQSAEKIKYDHILINGIKKFCMVPDYIFVSEILYTTEEKLAERVKYLRSI